MRQLRAEQEVINKEYERCESLVSTLRTVPCEIWAHIFSYFCESPDQLHFSERNAFSPHRMLWTISQVCQAWRNIAFSVPLLWSYMDLTFPADSQREIDVYMLERILRLSRQYPLHIVLCNSLDVGCSFGPSFRNLMLGKIFAESHHWRSVELIEDWADSEVLCPAETLYGRLPLLESSLAGSSGWRG
ncbi:hypothetical protein CPB85DRAFT_698520 [Mucidula mucida]|nr:hypothetical protein CPB85DRAFT_698520 [Mucidula mucida]